MWVKCIPALLSRVNAIERICSKLFKLCLDYNARHYWGYTYHVME